MWILKTYFHNLFIHKGFFSYFFILLGKNVIMEPKVAKSLEELSLKCHLSSPPKKTGI
jgi:hypothetical protein